VLAGSQLYVECATALIQPDIRVLEEVMLSFGISDVVQDDLIGAESKLSNLKLARA
jgi:hypothetical protein